MGNDTVPEFKAAYDQGLRTFKTPELARRWLTINLTADIRDGYYNAKQEVIRGLIKEAEAIGKTTVMSVMTDRKGTGYVPDTEPGPSTISNPVRSSKETTSILR